MAHETIHATAVEFCGQGILIRGASGMGKSTLALRLIDCGGKLVADDRALLRVENSSLIAAAPPPIAGLLEIHGIGLRRFPHLAESPIAFCLECRKVSCIPRLPEKGCAEIEGLKLPLYWIDPFEAAAVAKIRAIIQTSPAHD